MSADRNFLFGVLALQTNLIDRDQLIRALHAWVPHKERPLGEILLEQQALTGERHALLQALVQKHLQLHGDDPAKSLAPFGQTLLSLELEQIADPDLQATLLSLAATPGGPVAATLPPTASGPRTDPTGRFRILRPHARGGLGEVSVALEQELHRQVALKEIRPAYAQNAAARARFLLEAKVTGQLEHPGVVPIYGLGCFADGRPFYAMRFVQGDSLHDAIRQYHQDEDAAPGARALAFRRLLARFVDVCNAVAYAHSKGVLHRDLKPGNVLLGPYGETLVVDWGLAKVVGSEQWAVGSKETEVRGQESGVSAEAASSLPTAYCPLPTAEGQVLGTPGYMAPEQATGDVERLGPATDVYGLGATLYQLLTGRAPFEGVEPVEVLARACQGDFPRPRQVTSAVPAALEAVCQKAMALRPEERYGSPKALAEELERWLGDQPVAAYAEPLVARWRRQARRHPTALAAAAALLLAGLVGLGLGLAAVRTEQQRTAAERDRAAENAAAAQEASREAEGQAARARALNKFLVEDLLAEAAPEKHARTRKVTVEEVLDKAAVKVDNGFPGQPEVEADVRRAIGETYRALGLHERSRPQLEHVLSLRRERLGAEHPDTLTAVDGLASLLQDQGKLAEAEPLFRQNLEARRRVLGPEHPDTLTAVNNLAGLLQERGELAEAEPLFRQNLEARRRVLGPDHPDTLTAVNNLASLLEEQGELAEAEPLFRQNLAARRRVLGPEHPDTLTALGNLASLLQDEGKLAEAEPLFREGLAACRRVQGPEHPDTLSAMNNLAGLLQEQGKLAEAEPLVREELAACRRLHGPEHPDTLIAVNSLAGLLKEQGQQLEAERLAREALALGRKALPAGHPTVAESLALLGDLLTAGGRAAEAEPLLRECLESRRKALPQGHPKTAEAEVLLGDCLMARKQYALAEPLLLDSYRVLAKDPGTPEAERRQARQRLVELYEAWGKPSEAARWR
jgi:serine/threonine protein kinase